MPYPRSVRRYLVLLSAMLGFLGMPGSSSAQFSPPQPVQWGAPPPPVVLPVPIELQQTDVWCWLSASVMVIRYYNNGLSYQQCQILEIGYGLPPGTCCMNPQACRTTGGWPQIQAAIGYGGVSGFWSGPMDVETLYETLSQGHPVIAQIRSGAASTHAVVVRGMHFETVTVPDMFGRPTVQIVPFLVVNDPLSFLPRDVAYPSFEQIWMDAMSTFR